MSKKTEFTAAEAAPLIGVSERTLRQWAQDAKVASKHDERNRVMIPAHEVARLMRERYEKLFPDSFEKPSNVNLAQMLYQNHPISFATLKQRLQGAHITTGMATILEGIYKLNAEDRAFLLSRVREPDPIISTHEPEPAKPLRTFVAAKIHNIMVTDKDTEYHGSVSIDRDLMAQAGIASYEQVDIVNLNTGAHWTTYAVPSDHRELFSLNGGSARLGEIGDRCVVMTYRQETDYSGAKVIICGDTEYGDENAVKSTMRYEWV